MITKEQLDEWTVKHGRAVAIVYDAVAACFEYDTGSAAAAGELNHLNARCADLERLTKQCDKLIARRYVEAALEANASPDDARAAVAHLRALREQTENTMRHLKNECRFWAAGTWAMPARKEVINQRKGSHT